MLDICTAVPGTKAAALAHGICAIYDICAIFSRAIDFVGVYKGRLCKILENRWESDVCSVKLSLSSAGRWWEHRVSVQAQSFYMRILTSDRKHRQLSKLHLVLLVLHF